MSQPVSEAKLSQSVWRLQYEIPTDKFLAGFSSNSIRVYKAQIQVPKHRRFPGISASVWTIELTVGTSGGNVCASIYYGTGGVKCPETVAADFGIRPAVDEISPEKTYDARITHRGGKWTMNEGHTPLSVLAMEDEFSRYVLRLGAHVLITLTLQTEKEPKFSKARTTNSIILNTLFTSRTLADCTLICQDQDFPAHRAILAAQSPVFAAMFQNEMKEKTSGVCRIDDVSPDILEILLKFAYIRGPIPVDADRMELWSAADKYDMEDLRFETERVMIDAVELSNAVDYLVFAREYGLKDLKVKAAKFIGTHADELI